MHTHYEHLAAAGLYMLLLLQPAHCLPYPATTKDVRMTSRGETNLSSIIVPRDSGEFLGFRGTEAGNAAKYVQGEFDIPGLFGYQLGAGLYLTDSLSHAKVYAMDAGRAKNTQAMVCAFFATDNMRWYNFPKVCFAFTEQFLAQPGGDGRPLQPVRNQFAAKHGVQGLYVSFSMHGPIGNQAVFPPGTTSLLKAVCYAANDPRLVMPQGFSYGAKAQSWRIVADMTQPCLRGVVYRR